MTILSFEDISVRFTGGKRVDASFGSFIVKTDQSISEKDRAMVIRVAEQCAVKKMIENPPDLIVETIIDPKP
ncbi:MAG: hypothetical protein HW380_3290 [Magnetococcales bacterium]|nr:hypothetical protein [Magnetococcales bacterium]HIJ85627.1 hypothetical protein [Magnetococcales bacterium]